MALSKARNEVEQHIPVYGIIAASGNQWTVEFTYVEGARMCTTTKSQSGYGPFPYDRFPSIPIVDWQHAHTYHFMPSVRGVKPPFQYDREKEISLEEYLQLCVDVCGCEIIRRS